MSYHPSEKGIWDFHSSHATELPRKNFSSATMNHGAIVNLASLWGEVDHWKEHIVLQLGWLPT